MRMQNGNLVQHGLHLVKAKGRWYVYAYRGGPRIHSAIGDRPRITRDLLDLAAKHTKRPRRGLAALISEYKASPEFNRLSYETQKDYFRTLDRIEQHFGRASLKAFEDRRMRGDIIEWRDQLKHKPRTADKGTVMLGTLLSWGVERGMLSVNVAQGIPLLHSVNKADQIWERRHFKAMIHAPPQVKDALKIAAFTGLRLQDLVGLSWEHVQANALVLVTNKRKGRAVIPLTPTLRRIIYARPWREGTILRNSRGKPWTKLGLSCVVRRAQPEWFDRTLHDLRGTYVTWLASAGLSDEEIARIVGWTARRVADIRARYVDEQKIVASVLKRLEGVKPV